MGIKINLTRLKGLQVLELLGELKPFLELFPDFLCEERTMIEDAIVEARKRYSARRRNMLRGELWEQHVPLFRNKMWCLKLMLKSYITTDEASAKLYSFLSENFKNRKSLTALVLGIVGLIKLDAPVCPIAASMFEEIKGMAEEIVSLYDDMIKEKDRISSIGSSTKMKGEIISILRRAKEIAKAHTYGGEKQKEAQDFLNKLSIFCSDAKKHLPRGKRKAKTEETAETATEKQTETQEASETEGAVIVVKMENKKTKSHKSKTKPQKRSRAKRNGTIRR